MEPSRAGASRMLSSCLLPWRQRQRERCAAAAAATLRGNRHVCSALRSLGRGAHYLSIIIRWWCWPPALPRPPGCFLCLPER